MNIAREHHHGRTITIIVAIVVALALGLYVGASFYQWYNLHNAVIDAQNAQNGVPQLITTIKLPTTSTAQQQTAIDQLAAIKVPNCQLPSLYAWQAALPLFKSVAQTCRSTATSVAQTIAPYRAVSAFLKSEAAIAAIIAPITPPSDAITTDAWSGQLADVKQAKTALEKLTVASSASTIKSQTLTRLNVIIGAWNDLITANQNQDITTYTTASSALNEAYEAFADVSVTATNSYQTLLKSVE